MTSTEVTAAVDALISKKNRNVFTGEPRPAEASILLVTPDELRALAETAAEAAWDRAWAWGVACSSSGYSKYEPEDNDNPYRGRKTE